MPATHHASSTALPSGDTARTLARQWLGIDPARFVVLHVGGMAARAGIDTAILGVARLRQRHGVDAMLVVALRRTGATRDVHIPIANELARLRQLTHALGVAPHVRFACAPSPSALPDYHAAANVLATLPWCPSSGVAARAAMACARPVIGVLLAGGPGLVLDGVTGYLIPAHDAEALAARLARLQRLPRLAQAMGNAGHAHLADLDRLAQKASR